MTVRSELGVCTQERVTSLTLSATGLLHQTLNLLQHREKLESRDKEQGKLTLRQAEREVFLGGEVGGGREVTSYYHLIPRWSLICEGYTRRMYFKHLNGVGEGLGSVSVNSRIDKLDQPSHIKQSENLDKTFFLTLGKYQRAIKKIRNHRAIIGRRQKLKRYEPGIWGCFPIEASAHSKRG